jgi:hypothetical protein
LDLVAFVRAMHANVCHATRCDGSVLCQSGRKEPAGIAKFLREADEKSKGPASFMLVDPDGNPMLVDQHV